MMFRFGWKVSWVRVELEYEDCEWEVKFYTPDYYKESTKPESKPAESSDDAYD